MREGLLRLGLLLLSTALFLGPVLVALVQYNWDLAALIKPSPDLVAEFTPAVQPTLENWKFEVISYDEGAKVLNVRLRGDHSNPMRFPVRFSAASVAISCSTHRDNLGTAGLENTITVQPNSSGSIALVVNFTSTGFDHLYNLHSHPIGGGRRRVSFVFDIEGSISIFIYEIGARVPFSLRNLRGSVDVP